MSDSLKIPFDTGWSAGITITKDLARQIVALGAEPTPVNELLTEDANGPVEDHRDALSEAEWRSMRDNAACVEQTQGKPAKLILNPSGTMHTAQHFDMTRQIGPGIVDARHSPPVDFRMPPNHLSVNKAPVDAGGEDGAVEDIRLAMGTKAWDSYVDYAKNVVQLIRAGKVPNIVDATVLSDERGLLAGQYDEIATLRARLADAERRADEMEGKAGEKISAALAAYDAGRK